MKRRTWYCYRLEEKRNKFDKPYYGKTYYLKSRAKRWKDTLKLDYIPELHIEYTDTSEQRVYDFEQEKRIANGWPKESSLRHQRNWRKKGAKSVTKETQIRAGKAGGKASIESGHLAELHKSGVGAKALIKNNYSKFLEICTLGGKAKAKSVATITKEQGEEIKKQYEEMTKKSQRKLAREYLTSQSIIFQIVHGTYTNWKD